MKAAAVLALLAAPALAGPRAELGYSTGHGPVIFELSRCSVGNCWLVTLNNELVLAAPRDYIFGLDLDGFAVVIGWREFSSRQPDWFSVTPPLGYAAEPPQLEVEEGTTGLIRIVPIPLG